MSQTNTIQTEYTIGYRTIRNPKNTWVIRVFGLALVLFVINVGTVTDSQNALEWAENWVVINQLENDVIIDESSQNLFFASNSVKNNLRDDKKSVVAANKIIQADNTKSSKNSEFTVRETISVEALIPVSFAILEQIQEHNSIEVIESPVMDYQLQLSQNYAQAHALGYFEKEDYPKSSTWMTGGSIGPQFADGHVSEPSGQAYEQASSVENISSYSQGTAGNNVNQSYSAMLNLGLSLGNHFEILTGVNVSQMGGTQSIYYDSEIEQTQVILTVKPSDGNGGARDLEVIEEEITYYNYVSDTLSANYRFTTLDVPLVVKYNFGKKKLNYFVSSGLSTTIGSSYSAQFQSSSLGEGDLSEEGYGVKALNLLFGLGLQYSVSSNVVIKLSPGYRYGIPVSSTPSFQSPVSSLGVFTGLNYYF